jgi:hypothetical protein
MNSSMTSCYLANENAPGKAAARGSSDDDVVAAFTRRVKRRGVAEAAKFLKLNRNTGSYPENN